MFCAKRAGDLDLSLPQSFPGAERIVHDLGGVPAMVTVRELQARNIVQDDRLEMNVTEDGVYFHIPGM